MTKWIISVLDSIPFHHHVERFVYVCVVCVKESGTFDRAEAWTKDHPTQIQSDWVELLGSRISPIELPLSFRRKGNRISFDLDEEDAGCPSCDSHSPKTARLPRRTCCLLLTTPEGPQASPDARPRTHILIPFAGEATEQETSDETNGA